jgi:hypothetical protein
MKGRFLLCVVMFATGCAEQSSLSTDFSATPFRQLRGVELGMTGAELRRLRPTTKFTPYLGLQERLPGQVVSYQFESAMNDVADIDAKDRLQGVFITQMFESDAAATSFWRERVRALSDDRRAPDSCEQFSTGGMQARWLSGRMAFAIGVFPREPAAPHVGPRVIFAASPKATLKQPAGATTITCPNS